MMYRKGMRQIGVIVYGGGINAREWINREKVAGRIVMLRDGYAEIYAA